jgi:hypothetical protein
MNSRVPSSFSTTAISRYFFLPQATLLGVGATTGKAFTASDLPISGDLGTERDLDRAFLLLLDLGMIQNSVGKMAAQLLYICMWGKKSKYSANCSR